MQRDGERARSCCISQEEPLARSGDVTEQDGRCLEIPICAADISMPQIRTETCHMMRDGFPVARTGLQRSNGKCVAQVMNADAGCAGCPSEPQLASQPYEHDTDSSLMRRTPSNRDKQVVTDGAELLPDSEICLQRLPG